MRPLRDRLAELLRDARLGKAGGSYDSLTEEGKEDWRRSADYVVVNANWAGIEIKDKRK